MLSEKSLLIRPETSEVVASDGRSQKIDLLIGIPPHQAPEVVRSSELLGVSGFIHADVADPADTPRAAFEGKGYCWIELGDGRAGFAGGDFYAEPEPKLKLRQPGRTLHWGKVAFEKWWLHHWL